MMKKNLYVVSPELNDWIGKATFSPNIQFPWNNVSIAPKIDMHFSMEVAWKRLKSIDLDYFRSVTPIVSEKFANLCREMEIDCQLVPLTIFLNGIEVNDKFYFILLNKFVSIVNIDKTPHKRMMTMDGKSYETNSFFPEIPEFDMLENIVINDVNAPPFFIAPEIGNARVCTDEFKCNVERHKVKGIKFTEIDNNFRYKSLSSL